MDQKLSRLNFKKFNTDWESRCLFDYKQIESQNMNLPDSLYPGLGAAALYTSFADYQQLFERLPTSVHHVVDLGAGVGKLAPIWKSIRPEGEVSLIELVSSRIDAAKAMTSILNLTSVHLIQADLLMSSLPKAEAYFIYLPVTKVLEKILFEIQLMNQECFIIAIESHGNLYDRLSVVPGLELLEKIELFSERHNPFGHIYHYKPLKQTPSLMELALQASFQDKVLVIEERKKQWLGLSSDLVWSSKTELLLKFPPRTIKSDTLVKVLEKADFSDQIQSYLQMMREESTFEGSFIRKIWMTPQLVLEMQNGKMISILPS
ncbi:MAG: class I SAM-dependent methyltransferase [Bacteriovoracaceae bacterium]|jgi:hypothetical protein